MTTNIAASTALEFISKIPTFLREVDSGSLIAFTKPTRVEPLTLVSDQAARLPYTEEVLESALNQFCGYYLQAIPLSVNVGAVNVLGMLDRLNPNRDPLTAANLGISRVAGRSMESFRFSNTEVVYQSSMEDASVTATTSDRLNESNRLSLGKLIEVNVESEGSKGKFQIRVQLIAKVVESDVITHTLTLSSGKEPFGIRWIKVKAGQLRGFSDLLFARDLIAAHKKNLIKDDSGFYESQYKRKNKNRLASLLSGKMSLSNMSSIYVITSDEARVIEDKMRGRLDRFSDREKLFKDSQAMLLYVIDPNDEIVTVYHQSIEDGVDITIREMTRHNKSGKGPDINEILSSLRRGEAPRY